MPLSVFIQRNALLIALITLAFSLYGAISHHIAPATFAFFIAATLVQICIYCLPLLAIYKLSPRLPAALGYGLSAVYSLGIVSLILANYKLYSLYGFYINSFVFNIITTPGGIEALGANASTYQTLAMYGAIGLGLYAVFIRYVAAERGFKYLPQKPYSLALISVCFIFQGMSYAVANHQADRSILNSAKAIAWYMPITAKSFLHNIGVEGRADDGLAGSKKGGHISYPQVDPNSLSISQPYNIVWLVAESWRFDMLDPRIMPATSAFAADNIRYMHHYSGGNGTRMGMFTQFYGLYGSYWFDILRECKSPLLIDTLIANNYQMKAFTSAKFTYPEFDKTIFSRFSDQQLHSDSEGHGWQRDQRNSSKLIDYIENTQEPFFTFMFFESAHANYYFPDENIIEPEYLKNFDYLDTNIKKHIKGIKNRYINSSNHLDGQIARIIDSLKQSGKIDNTIIIITGDHGEEFMEKGRWGHNSTFSEEQVRVPLVLHIPGQAAAQQQFLSSHLDLPATVLHALGVDLDPSLHSFGQSLLKPGYQRDYTAVSDWHGNALVTANIKYVMSSKARQLGENITTLNDKPITAEKIKPEDQKTLAQFIKDVSRFYQ
ncbi:sulfatase-like hydrolase/transferase [Dasania sp. GY-MA-18]|uniref:Sulfatase-like hydrolase/transferase n=1 Tax=Dasania phycosphaerae TaxID=2950436 RepID=A0A9J6RLB0_9GAMM|nr:MULTISPECIES: sulfatase-like hydrolase/transferase [Dasania]MCR8922563.1 sulfatase-like hydrolase/transferase [Dasania sp. GY-MA-18]MCZ0864992.1 sulfatase-like hydrolase/transferase [Dasania phycosphaerae]MCZ0868719.1 sulfatase-like hydrolase/transferase [Dasania phycosphaerae]